MCCRPMYTYWALVLLNFVACLMSRCLNLIQRCTFIVLNEMDVSGFSQKQVLQCISQATRPVNMQFYRAGDVGVGGDCKDGDGNDRSLLTWRTTQHLNDNDGLYGTKSNPAQTVSLTYQVRQNAASSNNQASLNVVLAACVVCSSSTLNPSLARVKDAVMFRMYDVSGRLVWFLGLAGVVGPGA